MEYKSNVPTARNKCCPNAAKAKEKYGIGNRVHGMRMSSETIHVVT